ncbi:MAG: hypothetical protein IJU84_09990, partial [Clostridia bacterium]|nr:hypothetical protein [Clostridia bacterium]
YDVVILCHNESLRRSTLDLMDKFTGRTIVLGQIPRYCEYREEIDFGYSERYTDVNALVHALSGERFADIEADGIIGCKRAGKDGDVYLFCNGGDAERTMRAGLLKGAFALDMSCGAAYPLDTDTVTLYPRGSLAVFTGSGKTLNEWGIAVKELPVLSADGVRFSEGICGEITAPAMAAENENALVIDRADFTSGDVVLKDVPLAAIWHYRFYKLPEGTPFTISYKFFVEEIPDGAVELVIENAENADSITLNGKPVQCMRKRGEEQRSDNKSYKDLSFTRCRADSLRAGENEVVIRAKKINNIVEVCTHRHVTEKEHFPTEAEIMYVIGHFSVKRRGDRYVITKDDSPVSGNVAEGGYPFYSGALSCEFMHIFNGEQLLLEADCVYACLYVDGKKYVSGGDPLVFDTREIQGEKRVKLTLYNSLYALLGPHHVKGYDDLPWVDPGVFNDLSKYDNGYLVRPFGLKKIIPINRSEKR